MGSRLVEHRQLYHVDHDRKVLWILNRKNAGTSIREAIGCHRMLLAEEVTPFYRYETIVVLRHPWDRVTSAAYNPYGWGDRSFAQKIQEEILDKPSPYEVDTHFWPQWIAIKGFLVDRILRFERLDEDWKDLQRDYDYSDIEHQNRGDSHNWREEDFDWNLLLPWYAPDFEFCPEWEKKCSQQQ